MDDDQGPHPKTERNPRGAGRPLSFDETKGAIIVAALSNGAWRKTACSFAGVAFSTFKRWLREGRGRAPDDPLAIFARKVREVEHGVEIKLAQVVVKAAMQDADIALRFLAVRHRKRWNPKHQVTVSGDARHPLQVASYDLGRLSDDDLDRLDTLTAKATAPEPGGGPEGEGET